MLPACRYLRSSTGSACVSREGRGITQGNAPGCLLDTGPLALNPTGQDARRPSQARSLTSRLYLRAE
jgi:hypothetical protein